jgi:hypothetical protein
MQRTLLAAVGLLALATPAMAQYYPPPPPVYVRPGPPPPVYAPPPPVYYAPRPVPRFTCYVSPRYGGGACVAPRFARPGDRCGCPTPYGYGRGRVG